MDRPLHDPTALTKRKQVFKAISDLKQALRVGRYAIEDEPILNGDLLSSLEELVSPLYPQDVQPLLESGLLPCLVSILYQLLCWTLSPSSSDAEKSMDMDLKHQHRLKVEASVVHVLKALARHQGAAYSLLGDDSLQLLFHMIVMGSTQQMKSEGGSANSVHLAQLRRHVMQILTLLLVSDNGATAEYIHTHQLVKLLLQVVKEFTSDKGDAAFTIGVVSLLLECVRLSFRPGGAGAVLRDDLRKAHGYQLLVQLALKVLSPSSTSSATRVIQGDVPSDLGSTAAQNAGQDVNAEELRANLPPSLLSLFDYVVELAQVGPREPASAVGGKNKTNAAKAAGQSGKPVMLAAEDRQSGIDSREGDGKIRDFEAVQVLRDVFLKSENVGLQLEVLDRLLRLFASCTDNYTQVQELRIVPLFINSMGSFPQILQDRLLKVIEYAVTVVNYVPVQELLALCCLLQPLTATSVRQTILSFFLKLLSFDTHYKKVFREVGLLAVLLDDLKQCEPPAVAMFNPSPVSLISTLDIATGYQERTPSVSVSPKGWDLDSNKGSPGVRIFDADSCTTLAWDCLAALMRRSEANQTDFRNGKGVASLLPLLASAQHRAGALQVLSCIICEDTKQSHSEELGALIKVTSSGLATDLSGRQWMLENDAKSDILWVIWRILGTNSAANNVFGEAKGFGLLLAVPEHLQFVDVSRDAGAHTSDDETNSLLLSSCRARVETLDALLHVVAIGAAGSPTNRLKLQENMSGTRFKNFMLSSDLFSPEYEDHAVELLFNIALERVQQPSRKSKPSSAVIHASVSSQTEMQVVGTLGFDSQLSDLGDAYDIVNPVAVEVIMYCLKRLRQSTQIKVLTGVERLARLSARNQDALTCVGCVGLLLDVMRPLLCNPTQILASLMRVIELLGAYRLSSSEARSLARCVWQSRDFRPGSTGTLVMQMMMNMISGPGPVFESPWVSPFLELNMNKSGHASLRLPLGDRGWPPPAGYSFVCWIQYRAPGLKKAAEQVVPSRLGLLNRRLSMNGRLQSSGPMLHLFAIGTAEEKSLLCEELVMSDCGVLSLATSSTSYVTFSDVKLEEGLWYHVAVVHNKPNALAGLFQSSVAYLYVNGSLKQTGKLSYSAAPVGKTLQVTIGTPVSAAEVSPLSWRLGACYLYEEVCSSAVVFLMYVVGRGYRGLFQDSDLLRFVPNEACGGGNLAILESLEAEMAHQPNTSKGDSMLTKKDGRGVVWDIERLAPFWVQLSGKKLILALDGTQGNNLNSGTVSVLNLLDPLSSAASTHGGVLSMAEVSGDVHVCDPCGIGTSIRKVGGVAVVLALVEAAESSEMLHMSLTLLVTILHSNPRNIDDMISCRGYHLLALFLHRRMSFFTMQDLFLLFRIATCEASPTSGSGKADGGTPAPGFENHVDTANATGSLLRDLENSLVSLDTEMDVPERYGHEEDFSEMSELTAPEMPVEATSCFLVINSEMMEYVLLDWTLWVTAPVSIQLALLGFLKQLVSIHRYRNHNLTILRRLNLVQHLLGTLQRGDVDDRVLEELVVLLGVLLEYGFLAAELKYVTDFVIMTFNPPAVLEDSGVIPREPNCAQVHVRNHLLQMLIELQEKSLKTVEDKETHDIWHKVVSSRLITFLLDEAVHPTSLRWVVTLLGVCLSSSPTFSTKFRSSGGYQGLMRVLRSFYDNPEVYYILFCLMFGKPVFRKDPEVRMSDFHEFMPNVGSTSGGELLFTDLLESIMIMAKAAFDRISLQVHVAQQTGDFTQFKALLAAGFLDTVQQAGDDLQGAALMHKTYAARLMSGEASAPALITSLLRFMVDLAKMSHPFCSACRRPEVLEACVDLYFSCARAASAVQEAQIMVAKEQETPCEVGSASKSSSTSLLRGGNFGACVATPEDESEVELSGENTSDTQVFEAGNSPNNVFSFGKANPANADAHQRKLEESFSVVSSSPLNGEADSLQQPFAVVSLVTPPPEKSRPTMDATPKSRSSGGLTPAGSMTRTSGLASWLGSVSHGSSYSDSSHMLRQSSSASGMETPVTLVDNIQDFYLTSSGQSLGFVVAPSLLLKLESAGTSGGSCAAGCVSVLDLVAEILADALTELPKASTIVEATLEAVPLQIGPTAILCFQGLCLKRVMNFVERRLLQDDESVHKKLDKLRWSPNLDSLSWILVDRVYMGAFMEPGGPLKVLEFLLAMLQLANKDGRVEEATPAAKSILSLTRGGSRQVESYVQALLKNTNRMIMCSFLSSSPPSAVAEDSAYASYMAAPTAPGEVPEADAGGLESTIVLPLLLAYKNIVLSVSNVDMELLCCLVVNVTSMLWDSKESVRNLALDVWKALLLVRSASLEDVLITKPNQGEPLDVLHWGFDKALASNPSSFFEWLHVSHETVKRVLEQRALAVWREVEAGAARFPGIRLKSMEARRKREMLKKVKESAKAEVRHFEYVVERRVALDVVRETMAAELRVLRQDKYGWVLHAESEWHERIQQLIHERGVWPVMRAASDGEADWQLCPIEGPFRMRKKLQRRKVQLQNSNSIIGETQISMEGTNQEMSKVPSYDILHLISLGATRDSKELCETQDDEDDDESKSLAQDGSLSSAKVVWSEDQLSVSMHSAVDQRSTRSFSSIPGSLQAGGATPSLRSSAHYLPDQVITSQKEEYPLRELDDDGTYLIRPHLEPGEKVRFQYNCERVVGLDKHDGIFLIGELCLYVIENYYIDEKGRISEKSEEGDLSVIDRALGVKSSSAGIAEIQNVQRPGSWAETVGAWPGARAWAYSGGAWGKEKTQMGSRMAHAWRMWKLESVHELLKRRYQLRPVAIEIFSMDGCNELLVFHKGERDEVFKNLQSLNLPRNGMLDTTISGLSRQESGEGGRLFKLIAKSFSKCWQNGEISNFQYLMHLNTLAGRGYNDLTQYPVFPWILRDYESSELDLDIASTFRPLDKPMGALSPEREDEFRKRYESWDDPEIPRFHYGSHYSSAGSVLFYLIRLPPFTDENRQLQGGQFDHADRLFNSLRDTWMSASQGNTADVKELIPEFFYLPEFLENRFGFNFGMKQSGEKVENVILPPWAKGSAREFIRKHREALECQYVSENLHHWIDLIFGYKQRGKAAVDATNMFFHLTYEGAVDIDAISEPAMKASILAQINHFGQTPRQLFVKPHPKRKFNPKISPAIAVPQNQQLVRQEVRSLPSAVHQIAMFHDKPYAVGANKVLKPPAYTKYISWGFPDRSLRMFSYDQEKLLSTHENLHDDGPIRCAGLSRDGRILVTGGEDGVVALWILRKDSVRGQRCVQLHRALYGHTQPVTCLAVCQPYSLIVSGSKDGIVIFWDLVSLDFVRQLPELPAATSALHVNDLTGEVITAAGNALAIWSINGDCLAVVNACSQHSDSVVSITTPQLSDWVETSWYVTGHQNGEIRVWHMKYSQSEDLQGLTKLSLSEDSPLNQRSQGVEREQMGDLSVRRRLSVGQGNKTAHYALHLYRVLQWHSKPVTAVCFSNDFRQLFSGDAGGQVVFWSLPEENSNEFIFQL